MSYRRWTDQEIEYLIDNYGKMNLSTIAKKINRTECAAYRKLKNLKIKLYEATGNLTGKDLSRALGVDYKVVQKWIISGQLKSTKRILGENNHYYQISFDNFWEFAEKNKKLINFKKFKKNSLGIEPEWVEEARKADCLKRPEREGKSWTKMEDALLIKYWKDGMKNKDIAKELKRSKTSVRMRGIKILKLKPKQIAVKWKPIEIQMINSMLAEGKTQKEIAEELGRSTKSVCWKINQLKKLQQATTTKQAIAE